MRDEMRGPAKIVSEILRTLSSHVRPGVTPYTLDCVAESEMKRLGVFPYNKGYHPEWARTAFPAATCICVNECFAHGIPNDRKLQDGDIVIIDLGIIDKDGNCGDASITVGVGTISEQNQRLLDYAKKTTYAAIDKMEAGVTVGMLAQAMENKAGERNFVINRQMCSHTIGKKMHEDPIMYNVGNHNDNRNTADYLRYEEFMNITLTEGMVVCIEPILTFTDPWGWVNPNTGWEYKTKDKKPSAMFEHMVLINQGGHEVLTDHFSLPVYH